MTLTSTDIDNGRRVAIRSRASGVAGVTFAEGGGEVAFLRTSPVARGGEDLGEVDGRAARFVAVRKSETTPGMVLMRFEWAA